MVRAHGLHLRKTITKWDEAIPLGNGHLGALIWGNADALRFSLDRADIWDLTPSPRIFEEDFTYQRMIQLVKEGKEEEIRRQFSSVYHNMTPSLRFKCRKQTDVRRRESGYPYRKDPSGKLCSRWKAVWIDSAQSSIESVFLLYRKSGVREQRRAKWKDCSECQD